MKYSMDFWKPAFASTRDFATLQENINKLLDNALPHLPTGAWAGVEFTPECDLEETDGEFKLTVDLPGMKREDIKIEVVDNQMTVRGERNEEKKEENKNRKVFERHYGKFERTFALPGSIYASQIEATYKHGVLNITVPKTVAAKPIQIEVKEGQMKAAPSSSKQAV